MAAAARLEVIASTYGSCTALDVLGAVPRRIELMLDWIPAAAAAGDEGMINLLAPGEPARSQTSLDTLVRRIPRIATHLS